MSKPKSIPVMVETAQGERNKLAYDFDSGVLRLTKVLPEGFSFPLNFGSIPGTIADDGDPVDILLFMSDPVPPATLVQARVIGVLEAEQVENGKRERNDRLFGVAEASPEHRNLLSVRGIPGETRREYERFFKAYNAEEGKKFKALGWYGPKRAMKLVDRGRRKFRAPRKPEIPRTFADYAKAAEED